MENAQAAEDNFAVDGLSDWCVPRKDDFLISSINGF